MIWAFYMAVVYAFHMNYAFGMTDMTCANWVFEYSYRWCDIAMSFAFMLSGLLSLIFASCSLMRKGLNKEARF